MTRCIQYDKIILGCMVLVLSLTVVTASRLGAEEVHPVTAESGIEQLLLQKEYSWEALEAQGRTASESKRLSSNFTLQEEFSPQGQLQARLRKDGSREYFDYGKRKGMVSVWVTGGDGKFKEERLYMDHLLRAVLYADGSLKTLQHLAPLKMQDPEVGDDRIPALFVILSSSQKTKILVYNQIGKLIAVFLPDGTELMLQTQAFTEALGQVVNLEDLEIKTTQ